MTTTDLGANLSAIELAQLFEHAKSSGSAAASINGRDITVSLDRIDPGTLQPHDWT